MVLNKVFAIVLLLAGIAVSAGAAETYTENGMIVPDQMRHEKKVDPNDKYLYLRPKQLDCQRMKLDERYLGGKEFFQTVCFYDTLINNQHFVMWHIVGTSEVGFLNQLSPPVYP